MKKEFNIIANLVKKNAKVLDVGCGDGELMKYINENITNDIRGLEPQKNLVQKCISKGLSVIEGDAEKELFQFPENSFDYVVLSQTLQAFFSPEEVLDQLLRIGKQTIILYLILDTGKCVFICYLKGQCLLLKIYLMSGITPQIITCVLLKIL